MKSQTTLSQISYLLFDLGGVLVELNRDRILRELAVYLPAGCTHDWWAALPPLREFETGKITFREFAAALTEMLEIKLEPDKFKALFADFVGDLKPGAADLLQALQEKYRLGCLSNTNSIHIQKISSMDNSLLAAFADLFLSHETGFMKPDPAAYQHVLDIIQLPAREVIFFDDATANVAAARAADMNAYVVTSPGEINEILISIQ